MQRFNHLKLYYVCLTFKWNFKNLIFSLQILPSSMDVSEDEQGSLERVRTPRVANGNTYSDKLAGCFHNSVVTIATWKNLFLFLL